MKKPNIECQNHKTVHLERQTGWTKLITRPQMRGPVSQISLQQLKV